MKIKPVYIYISILLVIVLILIFTSNDDEQSNAPSLTNEQEMPADEIHSGLSTPGESPSAGNVSESAMHKLEMLKKAYEENPGDTLNAKRYADMIGAAHQPQKALEIYDSILLKDGKRTDVLLAATFVSFNIRDLDKAEKYTKKILAIDKDSHEANYNLGAIAASRGNVEKARIIWGNIIQKFPNSEVANLARQSLAKLK